MAEYLSALLALKIPKTVATAAISDRKISLQAYR